MSIFTEGIEWEKANCRGMNVEDFYTNESIRLFKQIKVEINNSIRPICMSCPIWEECLRWGFKNENYGIWGGLSEYERESFRSDTMLEARKEIIEVMESYGVDEEQIRSLM